MSGLIIGMIQTNVTITKLEEFPMIEEALVSDNFLGLIYTMVPKLLATISTTVWILDSNAIRNVSGNQTKFSDLTNYEDSYCTANRKQLAIKGKKNVDLSVGDKVLK